MSLLLRLTEFRSSHILLTMPVTRSRSKAADRGVDEQPIPKLGGRLKGTSGGIGGTLGEGSAPQKNARTGKQPIPVPEDPGLLPSLVPAELSFSFEEAKRHLIAADSRFQDVFDTAVCTPYQKLDRVEPFRWVLLVHGDLMAQRPMYPQNALHEHFVSTSSFRDLFFPLVFTLCLCRSQQISWMAARSICHRFVRLYNPSMPEKPTEESCAASFYSLCEREALMSSAGRRR